MTEEQIYISEKVKDSNGIAINPATSESQTEANEILDRMLFVLEAKLTVATITAGTSGTSKYVIYDSKIFGVDSESGRNTYDSLILNFLKYA